MPTVHQKHAPAARWVALTNTGSFHPRGSKENSLLGGPRAIHTGRSSNSWHIRSSECQVARPGGTLAQTALDEQAPGRHKSVKSGGALTWPVALASGGISRNE